MVQWLRLELSLLGTRSSILGPGTEIPACCAVGQEGKKKKKLSKQNHKLLSQGSTMGKRRQKKTEVREGKRGKMGWENGRTLYKLFTKKKDLEKKK